MHSCIFLVYFPSPSRIFSDALCGNVSSAQGNKEQSGSSRLRPSVQGGAAPPRGQQGGVHRRSAELGRGALLPSKGIFWAPDLGFQVRSRKAGAGKDKQDRIMKDLGLQYFDGLVCSLYFSCNFLWTQLIKMKECQSPKTHLTTEEYDFLRFCFLIEKFLRNVIGRGRHDSFIRFPFPAKGIIKVSKLAGCNHELN